MIEMIARIYRDPSKEVNLSYSPVSSLVTSHLASIEGLLYWKKGQKINAEQARRYLIILSGECIREFGLHAAAFAYSCIRDSDVLSDKDQQVISDRLIESALDSRRLRLPVPEPARPRICNHTTFGIAGSQMVAHLFPERKESKLLESYAEEIWKDWWAIRDNPEVTSLYEPFTQTSLIRVAELKGIEEQYFSDPIVKASFERCLQHLSPLGVMIKYGDSGWGDSWGFWAAVFEKAASHYSDGRFKWAARRILDYAYDQEFWKNASNSEKDGDVSLAAKHCRYSTVLVEGYGMVLAVLWSKDEIQEQVPDYSCGITHRYPPSSCPPFTRDKPVQEKLVLRSGWKKDDGFMVISLLKKMWHDHYDAGAILCLSSKGSLLLQSPAYMWREPRFHNGLLIRAEKEEFLSPQETLSSESFARVKFLSEHSCASFASISSSKHQGYPVEHTRTVIFGKKSHIVGIWDVAITADGTYQMGPLYHTQKIVSQGKTYFDTRHEFMMSINGNYWVNKPYNLLILFPLSTGKVSKGSPQLPENYWDGYWEPSWIYIYEQSRTQHQCLYQVARAVEGERKSFLSLLIPHSPEEDAATIAKSVRVISSDELSCCIKVGSVTLVFNNHSELSNDFITTDGTLVYIEEEDEKKHVAFHGAKNIILEGKRILSEARKSDGEITV